MSTKNENADHGLLSRMLTFSLPSSRGRSGNRDLQSVPEDGRMEMETEDDPVTLEGFLFHRKGSSTWRRRYVILDLEEGCLSCFRFTKKKPLRMVRNMYTRIHRRGGSSKEKGPIQDRELSNRVLSLYIPGHMPWMVRDVKNDPSLFIVEVPIDDNDILDQVISYHDGKENGSGDEDSEFTQGPSDEFTQGPSSTASPHSPHSDMSWESRSENGQSTNNHTQPENSLAKYAASAKRKGKPIRFYFHCPRQGNEKALWLRALSRVGRLNPESKQVRKLFGSLAHMARVSRIRSPASARFAQSSIQLERTQRTQRTQRNLSSSNQKNPAHTEVENLFTRAAAKGGDKEYHVQPSHAYPHRWMSRHELRDEMILPSHEYHDLSLPSTRGSEIGFLRVEVLQCLGLPKLDVRNDPDAVVYCVMGSYAFATDVIPACGTPMWLCKMRRACIFPIFHAYAKLYAGVFNDEPKRENDNFAGRVVIDVARLRPKCTYDVTIPLRQSTHVYSRRQRGAIRLRFHLEWNNEKNAVLSYLPKQFKIPRKIWPPTPKYDVTVKCSDPKAFRNVAITVHGAHLPGRYSTKHVKAALKEFNYSRIMVTWMLRRSLRSLNRWKNPAISMLFFLAWMHCIYVNSFALVPAYVMTFIFLLFMRNYARYGIDGPAQNGFVPPTWEELLCALIKGSANSQCFAPLNMQMKEPSPYNTTFSSPSCPDANSNEVHTHHPSGKRIFQALGFLDNEDGLDGMSDDDDHIEFPFANGVDYPRFTVKESLVSRAVRVKKSKKEGSEDRSRDTSESAGNTSDGTFYNNLAQVNSHDAWEEDEVELIPDKIIGPSLSELGQHGAALVSQGASLVSHGASKVTKVVAPLRNRISSASSNHAGNEVRSKSASDDDFEAASASQHQEPPKFDDNAPPSARLPEQNIDVVATNTGDSKLTDDLQAIKEDLHQYTYHLFNDKAYVIKDPNARFAHGNLKHQEKKVKRGEYDSKRELDRALNIGQYSHSNLFVARIGVYIEPIVGIFMSILCCMRAMFNLFTWRDPYLSFWVSLGCGVSIGILFIFPWRLFMFVLGIITVGPQNWIIRIYRERQGTENKRKKTVETPKQEIDQPVFQCHAPVNRFSETRYVNENEVHHVAVPYSPLVYQRFNDWPPESQYARVKADEAVKPEKTGSIRRSERSAPLAWDSPSYQLRQRSYSEHTDTTGKRQNARVRTHSENNSDFYGTPSIQLPLRARAQSEDPYGIRTLAQSEDQSCLLGSSWSEEEQKSLWVDDKKLV